MAKVTMTRGKFEGINACANERGIIAAAAMDQRGSLKKAIAKARGENGQATAEDMTAFKTAVAKILTRHASAILMDPEYGLEAIKQRAPGTGVLMSYEKTGYDASVKGRLPDLLPEWSVRRLVEVGADAIKILLYINPFDEEKLNRVKYAFVERIGAECAAIDVPSSSNRWPMTTTSAMKRAWRSRESSPGMSPPIWLSFPSRAMAWMCSRSRCPLT